MFDPSPINSCATHPHAVKTLGGHPSAQSSGKKQLRLRAKKSWPWKSEGCIAWPPEARIQMSCWQVSPYWWWFGRRMVLWLKKLPQKVGLLSPGPSTHRLGFSQVMRDKPFAKTHCNIWHLFIIAYRFAHRHVQWFQQADLRGSTSRSGMHLCMRNPLESSSSRNSCAISPSGSS